MNKILIAVMVLFLSYVGMKDCLAWWGDSSVSTSNVTISFTQGDEKIEGVKTKASAANTGKNGFAGADASGAGALSNAFNSGNAGKAIAVSDILSRRVQKEDAGEAEAINGSDGKVVSDRFYVGGGFRDEMLRQGYCAPDKVMTP